MLADLNASMQQLLAKNMVLKLDYNYLETIIYRLLLTIAPTAVVANNVLRPLFHKVGLVDNWRQPVSKAHEPVLTPLDTNVKDNVNIAIAAHCKIKPATVSTAKATIRSLGRRTCSLGRQPFCTPTPSSRMARHHQAAGNAVPGRQHHYCGASNDVYQP